MHQLELDNSRLAAFEYAGADADLRARFGGTDGCLGFEPGLLHSEERWEIVAGSRLEKTEWLRGRLLLLIEKGDGVTVARRVNSGAERPERQSPFASRGVALTGSDRMPCGRSGTSHSWRENAPICRAAS